MMFSYLLVLLSILSASSITLVLGQSCASPQITTCDTTLQSTPVPQPWYNLDFASAATGALATAVPWQQADTTEATGCYQHSGVVTTGLNGGQSDGNSAGFIDLYNASSVNSWPGKQLPGQIGGTSAGSVAAGTAGWTIELTWKPTAHLAWAKILNIGVQAAVSCFQIEWNGNPNIANNTQFTQYDSAQNAGYYNTMGFTTLNTWYHVVVVQQQVTPTIVNQVQANFFVYTNGALQTTNYGSYQFLSQAVARPQAYLGRSLWSSDPLYQAIVDSFRIYNYALTQTQVGALYQAAMGTCTVSYQATPAAPTGAALYPNFPLPTSSTPPAAAYAAEFTTNPATVNPSGYAWVAQDQDDVQCSIQQYHQGLVVLSDETQIGTDNGDNVGLFQYVDLGTNAGANGVTSPLSSTLIGSTDSTQQLGALGFSMEVTFKPQLSAQWAKLIDFGSTRSGGGCNNDVVFGWDNTNSYWQLDNCNANGNEWQIYDVGGVMPGMQGGFLSGSWYHAVIVYQQLTINANLSNWYVFVNNQLVASMSNTLMPLSVARQNVWLGRSGWGDTLWSGEIDNFRYYTQALGPAQINALYTAAMGPAGTQACTYTAYTTPVVPASSLFFSATFDTDPRPTGANYGWTAADTNDVVAGAHTGIIVLNGCTAGNCAGQYINLSQSTGPNSIGKVLPSWGGVGTGSFDQGNVGWTFELSWKAYSQQNWAKIFDFGTGNTGGQWDVLYGWHGGDQYMTTTVTNYYNTESQLASPNPTINFNQWYHTVWVIQSANGFTSGANFYIYTNGALTASSTPGNNNGNPNTQFPPLILRAASLLGKSNWGDNFFLGEIDTFNLYSIALNPNQVNTLYERASTPPGGKQNFSCVGAGFDMSSVGNLDYTLNSNGYNWVVHPCGYIDIGTCAPGASFCQGNNVVSYFEPTLNPILWQRITNGVQLSVTDGAQCGGAAFGRTGVVRFLCSETAAIPYLSQINEVTTCTYVAIIETVAACQPFNPNLITAVGEPFASPICGGGLYDLSILNTADITFTGNGYNWWLRPCAAVSNSSCSAAQPTSFCQSGGPYSVANYLGSNATTSGQTAVYTLNSVNNSPSGMTMQIADGQTCANQFPRVGILQFVCDQSATSPMITSIIESPIIFCHYTATIRTNKVCGAPLATNGGMTGGDTQLAPTLSNSGVPNGYSPSCGGAGFDVSQSNIDMFYQQQGGYTYYVHPCGNILGRSPCPAGTSMCQAANDNSGSAYIASRWNSAASGLAQWVAMPNGVQMTIATGDGCGSTAVNRYAVYNFVCDTSAISPQLAYVYEIEECHYEAYIATAQACTQYQDLLPSNANVNSTFFSGQCGGGVYPLSGLSSVELYQNATTGSPFSYVIRPCSTVQNPNCAGLGTSFCQYQGQPPTVSLPYSVAVWSATNKFNQWQVTPNGITLTVQDGSYCSVISNAPRTGIFVFVCNQTATSPVLQGVGVVETEVCHYTATIATNLVCPNRLLLPTSTPRPYYGSSGANNGGGVSDSSSNNSLSGGKLAAAIVVPIIGALLLACLCFVLGRAMSGGGKSSKAEGVSRNTNSHQPHYDEPSQVAGEQSTNTGVELA